MEISKGEDCPAFFGNLCLVTFTKKVIPSVQEEPPVFQFVPLVSCHASGHQWWSLTLSSSQSFHQLFIDIDEISLSLLFLRLNSHSSLSISLRERCSSPFIMMTALFWILYRQMSLLHWMCWSWTQQPSVTTNEGEVTSINQLAVLCLMQPRISVIKSSLWQGHTAGLLWFNLGGS